MVAVYASAIGNVNAFNGSHIKEALRNFSEHKCSYCKEIAPIMVQIANYIFKARRGYKYDCFFLEFLCIPIHIRKLHFTWHVLIYAIFSNKIQICITVLDILFMYLNFDYMFG